MKLKTSCISLTNRVEQFCLRDFSGNTCVDGVISRLATMLLSPAAAIDLAFHGVCIPIAFVYSAGKLILQNKSDFSLAWEHLQRVREAVFPLLFGSVLGLVHPYLGIYTAASKNKHIASGMLIPPEYPRMCNIVSPLSALNQISQVLDRTNGSFPIEYQGIIEEAADWEENLEAIQSLEILELNTAKSLIERLENAPPLIQRIAFIAYPLFAALDLAVHAATATLFLTAGIIQWIGGASPAYLEATHSPLTHLYQIAGLILKAIGLTAGFFVGIVSPKHSLILQKKLSPVQLFLLPQFLKLKSRLAGMEDGSRLLLPIVTQNRVKTDEFSLLPTVNSHMMYLLLQKNRKSFYAELINKSAEHRASQKLSDQAAYDLAKRALSLRFADSDEESIHLDSNENLIDLGSQNTNKNCVLTNLFAALEILNQRDHHPPEMHLERMKAFQSQVVAQYDFCRYDFSPFGSLDHIIKEINS